MSASRHGKLLGLVETAYAVSETPADWLERVVNAAASSLDEGLGVIGCVFDRRHEKLSCELTATSVGCVADAATARVHERVLVANYVQNARNRYVSGYTKSQVLGRLAVEESSVAKNVMHPRGIHDCSVLYSVDGGGKLVALFVPLPTVRSHSRSIITSYQQTSAHLAAGLRLARRKDGAAAAVLAPGGMMLHAEPEAQPLATRAALRDAARRIDAARARGCDEGEALSLWRGLAAGRFSLVEVFESDGRRLFVARENEPEVIAMSRLSIRERQVVALAAAGQSTTLIAYALGIAASTVSSHLDRATFKSGARSSAELLTAYRMAHRNEAPPAARAETA